MEDRRSQDYLGRRFDDNFRSAAVGYCAAVVFGFFLGIIIGKYAL